MNSSLRILFLIKRQIAYGGSHVPSKGLYNSASFVVNALRAEGIAARLVEVVDANVIDREVTAYRPTHCILEALWVTPAKLAELVRLHPRVEFVVRLHSKVPFLASEGIALEWLGQYGARVASNSFSTARALAPLLQRPPAYLPNIYAPAAPARQKVLDRTGPNIWISSLGSIRPLKNQVMQALAAREFAAVTKRRLIFMVNDRVEQGGEAVQRNLRALFGPLLFEAPYGRVFGKEGGNQLVEHRWRTQHDDVLDLVAASDIACQVSFSETFNIASADAVWRGVPIVVSNEISWAPERTYANPNRLESITERMAEVERAGLKGTARNRRYLAQHNARAMSAWKLFLLTKGK